MVTICAGATAGREGGRGSFRWNCGLSLPPRQRRTSPCRYRPAAQLHQPSPLPSSPTTGRSGCRRPKQAARTAAVAFKLCHVTRGAERLSWEMSREPSESWALGPMNKERGGGCFARFSGVSERRGRGREREGVRSLRLCRLSDLISRLCLLFQIILSFTIKLSSVKV